MASSLGMPDIQRREGSPPTHSRESPTTTFYTDTSSIPRKVGRPFKTSYAEHMCTLRSRTLFWNHHQPTTGDLPSSTREEMDSHPSIRALDEQHCTSLCLVSLPGSHRGLTIYSLFVIRNTIQLVDLSLILVTCCEIASLVIANSAYMGVMAKKKKRKRSLL